MIGWYGHTREAVDEVKPLSTPCRQHSMREPLISLRAADAGSKLATCGRSVPARLPGEPWGRRMSPPAADGLQQPSLRSPPVGAFLTLAPESSNTVSAAGISNMSRKTLASTHLTPLSPGCMTTGGSTGTSTSFRTSGQFPNLTVRSTLCSARRSSSTFRIPSRRSANSPGCCVREVSSSSQLRSAASLIRDRFTLRPGSIVISSKHTFRLSGSRFSRWFPMAITSNTSLRSCGEHGASPAGTEMHERRRPISQQQFNFSACWRA